MDIFAHWLWTYAAFHKHKGRASAAFFGVLPDLLSFGLLVAGLIATGNFPIGRPHTHDIPGWVFFLYNWTHSLVIFILVVAAVFLMTKKWYIPLLGWGLHILIDIPTHTNGFFPTPFLWPASDYNFNGVSWAEPWFMLLNYSALACVYAYFAWARRHKTKTIKKKSSARK